MWACLTVGLCRVHCVGSFIWDVSTGRALHKIKNHAGAIFRVDWNKLDPSLIATSSADHKCIVQTVEGKPVRVYLHPREVYGCHWSPFNKDLLATGCHDGMVRVYNASVDSGEPVRVLGGHRRRVFNTVWSPLLPNVLASGSDDRTVRVWNISSGQSRLLSGHTNNVRALVWSCEIPYILLSGSWDGSIRVWDTRTTECLRVVTDHHADVYGLDAHPARPFVFASSSRDTSLRFWILGSVGERLKLRAVLGDDWGGLLGDIPDDGNVPVSTPTALYGAASRDLRSDLAAVESSGDPLARLERVFAFFCDAAGLREFFSLARTIRNGTSGPEGMTVQHSQDIVGLARATAAKYQSTRMRRGIGLGAMKRDERQRMAAKHYLHVGDVAKYCDIMVQLKQWEHALAVAPAAGLKYWQALAARYAQHLNEAESDKAVPFLVATRDVGALTRFYEERGQFDMATLVAQAAAEGLLDSIPAFAASGEADGDGGSSTGTGAGAGAGAGAGSGHAAVGSAAPASGQGGSAAAVGASSRAFGAAEVQRLSKAIAGHHQVRSTTVMAACAHLAVSGVARLAAGRRGTVRGLTRTFVVDHAPPSR